MEVTGEMKSDLKVLKQVQAEEPSVRIAKYRCIDNINDMKSTLIAYVSQSDKRDEVFMILENLKEAINRL